MKDNSDIPLPAEELKSKVLVFAITDEVTQEYEQITKGYVELSTDEDEKNNTFHYLQVKDQTTNQVLMRSNLSIEKNFGKQKGSIISWTDEQQTQYSQLALSFEKDRDCDMFWRTICQKIGKNYLEINGTEKMQIPTTENLHFILEKVKNSVDLVDYSIVHAKSFTQGLFEVFYQMKNKHDQMGMGTVLRIVNTIMSPVYSSSAIQVLLSGHNFYLLLDLQQFKSNIDFKYIYQQKIGQFLNNKFNLPREIYEKIELHHRTMFYRENVLELGNESQLESIMFMIGKESLVQIVSYLNRFKVLEKIIKCKNYPQSSEYYRNTSQLMQPQRPAVVSGGSQQQRKQIAYSCNEQLLNRDKINFIHEALHMYQQITSEQIKMTFKEHLYLDGVLNFAKQQIQSPCLRPIEKENVSKTLQILYYMVEMDRERFFEYVIDEFRKNASDNLWKVLMKKYTNDNYTRRSILALVESLCVLLNGKKQYLQFFTGTFSCSILTVAKQPHSILLLAITLLTNIESTNNILNQLRKCEVFSKLSTNYRSGSDLKTKSQQLEMIKLLKLILIDQSLKKQLKNKDIQKNIIQSGYFQCCMMIFFKYQQKNNIISSSMLENLKLIQKMQYSHFDQYLINEYGQIQTLEKFITPIKQKYIRYQQAQADRQKQKNYQQFNHLNHEEILENEIQESYLLHDDPQSLEEEKHNSNITGNHQLKNENNNKSDNNEQLQRLKRMRQELASSRTESENSIQATQPRKVVKKTQSNEEMAMEFNLQLPDLEQLSHT